MRYGNELAEDLETHDDCDGDNNNGGRSSPYSLGRTLPRRGGGIPSSRSNSNCNNDNNNKKNITHAYRHETRKKRVKSESTRIRTVYNNNVYAKVIAVRSCRSGRGGLTSCASHVQGVFFIIFFFSFFNATSLCPVCSPKLPEGKSPNIFLCV